MVTNTRTTCFDARLLRGLVGTTVTTYDLVSDGASPEYTSLTPSTEASRAMTSPDTHSALTASPLTVVSASSGISRTWVIMEKLSERSAPMTAHDIKMCRGSAKTVGKGLCHLAEDRNQIAFMRIYQQIPISGTEDADPDTLARQAVPPGVCGELESFKMLQSGRCSAVPRFLGHAESTQGDDGLVPGGYIRYLVWEKVPGGQGERGVLLGLG
ncbi:Methionine aminopeptidase 1 [Penicillium atrosanguineum]|uniref:Methionine aminopeptidase 1 n=1 Tax=Penicillium atrosanguineum TaxID=1132637 RepID=UPI00239B2AB4|nr:Methionine aminopeptidase 1 [Penicillium atrosanguineum]KAJ5301146.1 Methionine aminopeptidase 1 [Penicillium atrosanguineum]